MSTPILLTTPELKFVFGKHGDRWSHQVVIDNGQQEMPLLSSLEGDSQQFWPPSPPLQDLARHEIPTGAAVLAVGMAGTSHWSASFSIEKNSPAFDPNAPSPSRTVSDFRPANLVVLADFACSCKGQPPESVDQLVSSYQIEPGVKMSPSENGTIKLTLDARSFCLVPLNGESWTSRLSCAGSQLTISASEICSRPGKPTRWGYRLMVCR